MADGKKSVSSSSRAGLSFPVARAAGRLAGKLQKKSKQKKSAAVTRSSKDSGVAMAASLEYLAQEILEVGGKKVSTDKRKRIAPTDIAKAVREDNEIAHLVRGHLLFTGEKLQNVQKAVKWVPKESE